MHYRFDGCDTVQLAERYGTPLYVMSESYIEERCREIRRDFINKFPNTRAVYASKAFQTLDMCRIMKEQGLGLDVVSGGELYTALKAGTDPADIIFHGNNKSYEECHMAVSNGVGIIVADNEPELEILEDIAERMDKKVSIMLRLTPGVYGNTHRYISTGHQESKFGFAPQSLLKNRVIERLISSEYLDLRGFHLHIGSQLTDRKDHLKAVDILLEIVKEIIEATGYIPRELNLGGGFGIQYSGDEPRKPLSYFTDPMMEKIIEFFEGEGLPVPGVIIEPGRWIAGEAGITIYRAGSVKTTPGGRTYVAVDGGFPDNPRTALYQAKYDVLAIEKIGAEADTLVTIAGKCCESGDIVVWDVQLPQPAKGDLIAVLCTGAYNYSMSSNYNRLPRPAVVMVKEGVDRLSVRRETYEDMLVTEVRR